MVDFQCKPRYDWADFLRVMALLRGPGGCPWDAEQTHDSIRRNFLEETYETLDALDRDDAAGMCEELGDVLMQVAFHAQIEAERGRFTMDDVVDGVTKKLVYRHPHVFGTVEADTSEQVLANWEVLKRREKGQRSTADAIESVPHTLPALWRAEKIQSKDRQGRFRLGQRPERSGQAGRGGAGAARGSGVRQAAGRAPRRAGGSWATPCSSPPRWRQMSGVDPEDALHRACDKFDQRFRYVEAQADKPLSAVLRGGTGEAVAGGQGAPTSLSLNTQFALRNKI